MCTRVDTCINKHFSFKVFPLNPPPFKKISGSASAMGSMLHAVSADLITYYFMDHPFTILNILRFKQRATEEQLYFRSIQGM